MKNSEGMMPWRDKASNSLPPVVNTYLQYILDWIVECNMENDLCFAMCESVFYTTN